jgi:outer membrane receptor protein involved in Fe transport
MVAVLAALGAAPFAHAQGVTTGSVTGLVTNAQQQPVAGASVIAIHEPSGTSYEGTTRADGRYMIPNMRVGGPYTVTVAYTGAGTAFEPQTKSDIIVNLGVATDLPFSVTGITVTETVTVTAVSDTVFSSGRTGAATSVSRAELATLPTVSGRLNDMTRLTPQANGLSFAGQDNRLNNITVDGSYFNNSFGLQGAPGERTGVAPISLEAIEQIQVNVAPFDVRQGNFVGAGVNTVTRSGTNRVSASVYHRFRNEEFVGTEAKGLAFNPGEFSFRNTGVWGGGPILKNKLFAFGTYEDEEDSRPITTFRANAGGEPVGGNITRVLASDLTQLSSVLAQRFNYQTGPFGAVDDLTPVKRFLLRNDYNLNSSNKISFRYNYLDSVTDVIVNASGSLGRGRGTNTTNFLSFQNSYHQQQENIRSGISEWNSIIGTSMSNSLIVGYTTQDESRPQRGELFPLVDIWEGGQSYTSFGYEPFTPRNALRYQTFQLQDNFTKFGNRHSLTFGASLERYESQNVFFPGSQSVYVYDSLADFYADVNSYVANPNRTVSPITLNRFQVRYMNIPNAIEPLQPLQVWYGGAYAQDEWRPRSNLTVTAGLRLDVPVFGDTGFANSDADGRTFRSEDGQAARFSSGELPDPKVLWSPRVGLNWDVSGDTTTQVRGGTGVFTGRPAYVWISNQIGNTGVLTGFDQIDATTTRPFNPDPNRYKPTGTPTGAPAAAYELALTDPDFKFPQIWRSNVAVDRRLPWNVVGTAEFLYNKDLNGVYYINANLPAAQTAFAGADTRPRWTSNRIHSNISNAIVLKNQDVGSSWNFATTLAKRTDFGLALRGAYSYGKAENTVDAGSIAFGSWAGNPHSGDPNNPGLALSSHGHRVYVLASFSREYFKFGATAVSLFWEGRNNGNASYVFAGDMNGDGASNSDLIYIPRNASEMNFATFTAGGRTFTADQQAQAFEAYIQQDTYLREHRGEYAKRGAVLLPFVKRADLSITQDLFTDIRGRRNAFQIRADVLNFGNMLNSNWGVGKRLIRNQILTNGAADAQGRATYRLAVVNNELLSRSYESTTFLADVFSFMVSVRYSFQ